MHSIDIQTRFGDTDAKGHLNNAVFASYTEIGRLDFLESLGVPTKVLILAHLSIDFVRQVRYGDRVRVENYIEAVGNSSLALRQRVMANDVLTADVKAVTVFFNFALQKPEAIPSALRTVFTNSMNAAHEELAGTVTAGTVA